MEKLNMTTADIGFQTVGRPKSANQTADVSGDCDFRKMLQNKNKDAQESQNTQDKDQAAGTDKTEASDDKKQEAVSKDKGKADKTDKTDKTDKQDTETDTSQAEAMIAAQLRERFSYGFSVTEQGTEETVETEAPEASDSLTAAGTEELLEMAGIQDQTAQVQTETAQQLPQTGRVQSVEPDMVTKQPEQAKESAAVSAPETVPITSMENAPETQQNAQDYSSGQKETAKLVRPEEKTEAPGENLASEHAAAAAARPETAYVEQPEVEKPEMAARVYVEQPEELPEKVTDTLLAKLVEGVKEFEIHIEPANLGKIAVKVLYEGNQTTISIICSEKRAMDALSQNVRDIGNIIERNLGGETTIIVDKQETDYLNQTRDENEQAEQNARQQQKEKDQNQDGEDAEQFLQKLRLGLTG